jgi:hypothetical protein
MLRKKMSSVAVAGMMLALTACADTDMASDDTLPSGTSPEPVAVQASTALVEIDSCDAFLDYVIEHALELVGPYGLEWSQWGWPVFGDFTAVEESLGADDGGEAVSPRASSEFSQTNVQVEGVDEPDIVKTDGERIVLIAEGSLIVVDVTGEEPVEVGRLSLGGASIQSLFLSGDMVLGFGSGWQQGPVPLGRAESDILPPSGSQTVQLVEFDISGGWSTRPCVW